MYIYIYIYISSHRCIVINTTRGPRQPLPQRDPRLGGLPRHVPPPPPDFVLASRKSIQAAISFPECLQGILFSKNTPPEVVSFPEPPPEERKPVLITIPVIRVARCDGAILGAFSQSLLERLLVLDIVLYPPEMPFQQGSYYQCDHWPCSVHGSQKCAQRCTSCLILVVVLTLQ